MGDERGERRQLKLGWNEARTERLLTRVKTRIDGRARLRRALFASAALASVLGGAAVVVRTARVTSGSPATVDAAPPVDALAHLAPAATEAGRASPLK